MQWVKTDLNTLLVVYCVAMLLTLSPDELYGNEEGESEKFIKVDVYFSDV